MNILLDPVNFVLDSHRFIPVLDFRNFTYLSFGHRERNFYVFDRPKHIISKTSQDGGKTWKNEADELYFVAEYFLSDSTYNVQYVRYTFIDLLSKFGGLLSAIMVSAALFTKQVNK